MQSIDANPATACSEFEWRARPVTYLIAAKFIMHTAGARPCIQAKCRVIRQSEVNPAAPGLKLVAAQCVQGTIKGNRITAGFLRRFPASHGLADFDALTLGLGFDLAAHV